MQILDCTPDESRYLVLSLVNSWPRLQCVVRACRLRVFSEFVTGSKCDGLTQDGLPQTT